MLYREAGQFKSSYIADSQIFPIRQDRIGMVMLLALALNILTGYAGQLLLGSAAFMAVGAYAAYNFQLRIEGMPILLSFILAGVCAAAVGVLFGLPSLRIKGFYLAVATLAV